MNIDLNRGVTMRNGPGGMRVCMYKDQPGVFLDINGKQLPASVAAQAGFDVEALTKTRKKNAAISEAKSRIEAEFMDAEDDVERVLSAETGHEVRHLGFSRYAVFDAEGNQLTKRTMTKAQAQAMVAGAKADADDPADGDEGGEGAAQVD